MKGMVLDIHRSSFHDGPGVRTTVFLKGCPLRCVWCHNPESFCKGKELRYQQNKCIFCKACEQVCPQRVHDVQKDPPTAHLIQRANCISCGKCEIVCPTSALSLWGREMEPEEVLKEIIGDLPYYQATGGGVTVSGGEPLMQPEFTYSILKSCKEAGIHTCVETCGDVGSERLLQIMEVADLFLYDLKASDKEMQKKYTKGNYENILSNLKLLCENHKEIWLRCPIVPGIHDTKEHFHKIAQIQSLYPQIKEVHLMAYHSYGKDKWKELGKEYALSQIQTVSEQEKKRWVQQLQDWGGDKLKMKTRTEP